MRSLPSSRRTSNRAGLAPADVVVAFALAFIASLFVLMALPRTRETARLASCRRNLAQIGQALQAYHGVASALPRVDRTIDLDSPMLEAPPSPQKTMLQTLGVSDFLSVDALQKAAVAAPGTIPTEGIVAGFLCPSDSAGFGRFRAPVSYRACAGSGDEGSDGPFAPGRPISMPEIAQGDGVDYTAAFSERLLGDGRDAPSHLNYGVVGSMNDAVAPGDWRGDAGSLWQSADYRYTLYTHAAPPGAFGARVSRDGGSSTIGASSAHPTGVNVLMVDGSARTVTPTVDPVVWRAFGSVGSRTTPSKETSP